MSSNGGGEWGGAMTREPDLFEGWSIEDIRYAAGTASFAFGCYSPANPTLHPHIRHIRERELPPRGRMRAGGHDLFANPFAGGMREATELMSLRFEALRRALPPERVKPGERPNIGPLEAMANRIAAEEYQRVADWTGPQNLYTAQETIIITTIAHDRIAGRLLDLCYQFGIELPRSAR